MDVASLLLKIEKPAQWHYKAHAQKALFNGAFKFDLAITAAPKLLAASVNLLSFHG